MIANLIKKNKLLFTTSLQVKDSFCQPNDSLLNDKEKEIFKALKKAQGSKKPIAIS